MVYHIRWPPLNVTIFITHVRNCVIGATPMHIIHSEMVLETERNGFDNSYIIRLA